MTNHDLKIRIPDPVKSWLERRAMDRGTSMNSEIVNVLSKVMNEEPTYIVIRTCVTPAGQFISAAINESNDDFYTGPTFNDEEEVGRYREEAYKAAEAKIKELGFTLREVSIENRPETYTLPETDLDVEIELQERLPLPAIEADETTHSAEQNTSATLAKWGRGNITGYHTLLGNNLTDVADSALITVLSKKNPKTRQSGVVFSTYAQCRTVGAFREKHGATAANHHLAWDINHMFITVQGINNVNETGRFVPNPNTP